jgi:drug/metabolite transporter (DMT)-like permease
MLVFFADSMSGGNTLGNILAILSGFTFAGQAICMRLQKEGGGLETIVLGNLGAVMIGLPFIVMSPPSLPHIPPLLFLGVFQLGVAYLLYSLASRNVTALDIIVIPMIEPILNPIWVFIGLGEAPGAFAILGGFIVIIAVGFKSFFSLRDTGSGGDGSIEPGEPAASRKADAFSESTAPCEPAVLGEP